MNYEGDPNTKVISTSEDDAVANNVTPVSPTKPVHQQVHSSYHHDQSSSKQHRKIKQPRQRQKRHDHKAADGAEDVFEDIDPIHNPSEDEIVIPEHLISQVHTSTASDKDKQDKRLSTITTSSYTKKVKKNYVGPWKLGRTLGRGATGRVRLAKHSRTGQLAAVKIIPKSTFKDPSNSAAGLTDGIEREIIIMKLISHPNIMALYDVWENKGELYLILEYVEKGELFNYLVKHIRLAEREAVHYFKQIIAGVNYCHSFNICHRDLKPENLLLDRNHNIKIADFGMAALEVTNKMLNTSCGSPHYASPEVVTGESYHGGPSDIWSCGIILFALLTGHLPFDDEHMTKLLAKVRSGIFRIPSYISVEARDLIKRMLTVNPAKRITIEEILVHPLLKKYPDSASSSKKNKNYMEPPLPKDIMKKPIAPETIDREILKNLQTLWHGEKKSKIVEKLMANEENAEKLFYYLLLKYRQEHAMEAAAQSAKSKAAKKKQIVQTTSGETTARDLISQNKLTMTKSKSIVSTTITDEHGNKTTQISKEPLSKAAKVRSTSYKKLANSKYSLHKIDNSTSRTNNLTGSHTSANIAGGAGNSGANVSKRRTRDIDGNLVISASSSYRKSITFHTRAKSTNSFKSFKNLSGYNSNYNMKTYQGIDNVVASSTTNKASRNTTAPAVTTPVDNIAFDELDKENNAPNTKRGSVQYDFNFQKAAAEACAAQKNSGRSNSRMTKSASKRDSFNAFSIGSIPNYAAMLDQIGLPDSPSGKSLTSPKKKQRKSLSHTGSIGGGISAGHQRRGDSNGSIKKLSNVSSRSKRSILNSSTSKKNIRYSMKKEWKKSAGMHLPDLPKVPGSEEHGAPPSSAGTIVNNDDDAENTSDNTINNQKSPISSKTHKKVLGAGDFGPGLSNSDFAFFCEQVFGFDKDNGKKTGNNRDRRSSMFSQFPNYKELEIEYQKRVEEDRRREEERVAAIERANELTEKVKMMVKKAQQLELENQRLKQGATGDQKHRSVSLFAGDGDVKSGSPEKLKQRRAISDFTTGDDHNRVDDTGNSPVKFSKANKAVKNKNVIPMGQLSQSHSGSASPSKKKAMDRTKTVASEMTNITTTTTNTDNESRYQDAVETMAREVTNTSSTFSFNFGANKRNSIISTDSRMSDTGKKTIFAFGQYGTAGMAGPRSPSIVEEGYGNETDPNTTGLQSFIQSKNVTSSSTESPVAKKFDSTSVASSFDFDKSKATATNDIKIKESAVGKKKNELNNKHTTDKIKSAQNSSIIKGSSNPPTSNAKISLIPQRDAPKPPSSKNSVASPVSTTATITTSSKNTQTSVKSVVAKSNNLVVKANATTTTTTGSGFTSLSATPGTPTTATTSTTVAGITGEKKTQDNNTVDQKSKTSQGSMIKPSTITAKAKLGSLEKNEQSDIDGSSSTITSPTVDLAPSVDTDIVESKGSKAPSIKTMSESIITNPKVKQSWFSKVINNFVPSSSSSSVSSTLSSTSSSEEEFRYESFLSVEDVQTLIRNSLALRLKEGSVSKVKFESNSIYTVVPAKLAGSRSLKVKIIILPLRIKKGTEYVEKAGQKILSDKKKCVVIVNREKGPSKAFARMGQTIQFSIQTEETQFRTRESRLTNVR
ncbi:protein kinase [Saccharomycopsis crataegensis]|uniref:non-specific serine/threonine protein kinase n=1 Tax=Saccharomycopsis crataegensis TaxID=43959 RepID=A0AAV5QEM6_9ASCO|nr:protein kinase [Saccharomycopsis crataegensis]